MPLMTKAKSGARFGGRTLDTEDDPGAQTDQVVELSRVRWDDYERLLAIRGEKAVPRITYVEGELELMSPSWSHERIAAVLGLLVAVFAAESEIPLSNVGTWTIKKRRNRRGLEPDECFVLGIEKKKRPDIAIEVVLTSGGIDKLEVYRKLDVPEVWFWEGAKLQVYILRNERHEPAAKSTLLPSLDLALLARLAACDDQADRDAGDETRRQEAKVSSDARAA